MGKNKHRKQKETRLDKKLRKLAKAQRDPRRGRTAARVEVMEAADAVVPAEVQLGGGDVLGSLAQVVPAVPAAAREAANGAPSSAGSGAGRDGSDPAARGAHATASPAMMPARNSAVSTPASTAGSAAAPQSPPGEGAALMRFERVGGDSSREVFHVIQERRSHKRFLDRPVPRRALEVMLEAAVLAPNHKMTEPWGFVVMGETAKHRYGEIRARHKAGADADADKRAKIADEVISIPTIIAVTMRVDDDLVRREEDHAATFMALQNLLLAATALGLGTKINTGRVMDDGELRKLVGVRADERIVALVNVGVPAESRGPGKRTAAKDKTTWLG